MLSAICGCAAVGPIGETIYNDTGRVSLILDDAEQFDSTLATVPSPITTQSIRITGSPGYQNVTLSDILQTATEKSDVLRDLGGKVLRSPEAVETRYASALQKSDPRFSAEAALSAFDAQLQSSAVFNNNDRIFNNPFFSGGINAYQQDLNTYKLELFKRTASGSLMSLRSVTDYDANNAPGNTFGSVWNSYVEGEVRQPLLQGGGLQFNRIAGPGSVPGIYNGVLIARVNSKIGQADFEISVRDYFSNVVNAYWDLYYSYRDLDARRRIMEKALESWRRQKARAGDDAEDDVGAKEALVREQYFRLKMDVNDSLTGRLVQGTQNRNGSPGGTLRGSPGVQVAERRLRLLIGLPINDGTLLRPVEDPVMAEHIFDWDSNYVEALASRPELKRQRLHIKRREMELLAAQNFVNPRLDAFGRYRYRGFGKDLIGDGNQHGSESASALGNLATGDTQEWAMGVELSVPIGYRQASIGVTNAELQVARAKSIEKEQHRQIAHDLSNALADQGRAFEGCQLTLNRYLAAREILDALEAQEENEIPVDVERMLEAQRRVVDAELDHFRSRAEYAVSIKNVHFTKGTLLAWFDFGIQDTTAAESALGSETIVIPAPPSAVPGPPEMPEAFDFGAPDGLPLQQPTMQTPTPQQPRLLPLDAMGYRESGSGSIAGVVRLSDRPAGTTQPR